jgi:hypothetical protein
LAKVGLRQLVNLQADKEQFLWMEMPFINLQVEVQPLWMEVLQVVTFSNIVDLLKTMSLTPHACSELKSFDYWAITIEFVNYLPTKFNGDILFELPPICHPLGQSKQLQGMDKKFDAMLGVSCRLITSRIHLDWAS